MGVRRGNQGLSYAHISSLPSLKIAEGGKFLHLKSEELQSKQEFKFGTREKIKDFSAAARARLQRKLATINEFETGLPDFLTLTYPGEWSRDWRVWKRDLDVFRHSLIRRWPDTWGVWRLEFQEREAPHYHFLLWDGPKVEGALIYSPKKKKNIMVPLSARSSPHNKDIFEWLSKTWYRIVGSGDPKHLSAGTRIEPINTWNGVVYYASKYLAKLPSGQFSPVEFTGRFWGVIQGHKWKVSMFEKDLDPYVFFKIRRVLRKRHGKLFGFKKGRVKPGQNYYGMHAFIDSVQAFKLLTWAWGEGQDHCPF